MLDTATTILISFPAKAEQVQLSLHPRSDSVDSAPFAKA